MNVDSPRRRVLRIALTGASCVLAVMAGGRIAERVVLGADDAAIRARVERDVRGAFDVMSRGLETIAQGVADAPTLAAASREDENAARKLFDTAQAAAQARTDDVELAVTAYGAGNRPLAWAGRPSELPRDRLEGDQAWFITQGALGLRLVYAMPVNDAGGNRVGTVAAEQSIRPPSSSGAVPRGDLFEFPGELVPVSLELAFEDIRVTPDPDRIDVTGPNGRHLVTAVVTASDLAQARADWRQVTSSVAEMTAAIFLVLLCGPLLDWRNAIGDQASEISDQKRTPMRYGVAVAASAIAILFARVLLRLASPADWADAQIFSAAAYASPLLRPLLASPFDYLVTAATAAGLVALTFFAFEAWRVYRRHARIAIESPVTFALFFLTQLAAGVVAVAILLAQHALLADTVANTTLDLLHFSLHPWNTALTALQVAIVIWDATALAAIVLLFRAAYVPWRVARSGGGVRVAVIVCWTLPYLLLLAQPGDSRAYRPLLFALALAILVALFATRLKGRHRQGSQAFRLTLLSIGLVLPALAFYADVFALAHRAKMQLVETRYGPQALNQRQTIQSLMQQSLQQIDAFPGLADLVSVPPGPPGSEAVTDRAFQVWRITGLATYPITSSVELFGPDGRLVSRFAFNLPDDLNAVPTSEEDICNWDVFEEVSPFFAVERRVLSASRAACVNDPQGTSHVVGSVVVHAMLDYANLPFIASKSPYVELLRPTEPSRAEGVSGDDIEFAVYGWSRTPFYSSTDTAWRMDDAAFEKLASSRTAMWARLYRVEQPYDVYLLSDRGGIYALGFPVVGLLGHMMNLAELTVIGAVTFLTVLLLAALFNTAARRATSARALLREIRASFYRKLFLAFVAAAVVPVVALALVTRNYVAAQMRANVDQEAARTASAAQRVVEDLVAPRAAQQGVGIDDNLMVWVSRLIDQDVNIFTGPRLLATSERNLFASGVLPVRTPADVYVSLQLRNEATTVTSEQVGRAQPFLVAGTRMTARQIDAILTVPLASRAQEIEAQIDTLDRQVLLAALLFIMVGAGIGYYMAERIADPVNRLTRATRRIAGGELSASVVATSSDELGRLVDDFNSMARDLARQRADLERTNRLEAWAEMARQVAHEIKNPLTPIQLNAEHLRRVNADRGQPLSPVLDQSVSTILNQVKLLRQIASEFSSFASSPTVQRAPVDVAALLHEIIEPYRAALAGQIAFNVDVPSDLPPVSVDRTLITRALTNIIENALHAMGSRGTLTIVASHDEDVRIRVSDTGSGMDADALARAFEPYFSTKASGTGLGLPIAKRNVESSGGSIGITSVRGEGTTVEIALPLA